MLNGVKIYSKNSVWRHILFELGATVVDEPDVLVINFDKICPKSPISVSELKTIILNSLDNTKILRSVFGKNIPQLSDIQTNIIVSLVSSGGMTNAELKKALGYTTIITHAIDTAIYNLRKVYGYNFIIMENGVYKIGAV